MSNIITNEEFLVILQSAVAGQGDPRYTLDIEEMRMGAFVVTVDCNDTRVGRFLVNFERLPTTAEVEQARRRCLD